MNDASLPAPAPALQDQERRQLLLATGAAGGAAAVATALPFVSSFAPSERARSMGSAIEVEIGDLRPGETKTVEWRGKPVWIARRTHATIEALRQHNPELADPQSQANQQPDYARNPLRSIREEFFVAIGVCTHLGCSPTEVSAGAGNVSVGADWKGGYFCPCHGSTFDAAGRVFSNKPAPSNLEVPPHRYLSETRLLIGEESTA